MTKSQWLNTALLLVLISVVLALSLYGNKQALIHALDWLKQQGSLGIVAFIALYAVATVLFVPGALITLAGGAIYGPIAGTVYNLTGASLGALLAFLIARHLTHLPWLARWQAKASRLQTGVRDEGWRFVAFVRLVPLFPFNLVNYLFGLSQIKTRTYFVSTIIFMLPGAAAYTYFGYAGRSALSGERHVLELVLISAGFLLLLIYLPYFVKRYWRQTPTGEQD